MLALAMLLPAASAFAAPADEPYSDMPTAEWSRTAVTKAKEYGLMEGVGGGLFGTGRTIRREEFATVLVRMFGWAEEQEDAFDDIAGRWSRTYINAAAKRGAVDTGGSFRPEDLITRREMAVMLVRALGYGGEAEASEKWGGLPFTDVSEDKGYISVAYDIGMTTGVSATSFAPEGYAKREEAAAMLVRIYERRVSPLEWRHAFYAISSYSQLELAKSLDAVSLGWSRMRVENGAPRLFTSPSGGNEYCIPEGYETVTAALSEGGVRMHLDVVMNDVTSAGFFDAFSLPENRSAAVDMILKEVKGLGLDGATIDFEGLRAPAREPFTLFLRELDAALESAGLTLYVAVMPATADGVYYDGYDYREIGGLADKVILMAHDYAPRQMDENLIGSTFYKNAALTPINSVYYSLRAACDPETGVRDRSKLALAVSMTAMAWETDDSGKLTSTQPQYPSYDTVLRRIEGGATMGWSSALGNPYLTYRTEDGQNIFLWYEDERSVGAKLDLMRLFGVTGVSVWRLGTIPDERNVAAWLNVASLLG